MQVVNSTIEVYLLTAQKYTMDLSQLQEYQKFEVRVVPEDLLVDLLKVDLERLAESPSPKCLKIYLYGIKLE